VDTLERVLDSLARSPKKGFTVAITGPNCAGKTTAAKWLTDNLERRRIASTMFSVDSYLRHRRLRTGLPGEGEDYYQRGFDVDRLPGGVAALKLQLAGEPSERDHIIVEGVFLLRDQMSGDWDISFWLDIDDEEMLEQGVRRGVGYFGSEECASLVYRSRMIPAQQLHRRRVNPETRASVIYDAS
jgi:hypothetical protein